MKKILCLTLIFVMLMSMNAFAYTMYAPDGRTIEVNYNEADAWRNVGWYDYPVVVVYAPDGRSAVIYESDLVAWENVGWIDGRKTTTIYAPDGRTANIPLWQLQSYLNVGWYSSPVYQTPPTQPKARPTQGSSQGLPSSGNSGPTGYYYRTPTGKRYHKDPDCGGKSSYRTNDISGLTPCQKCC